MAALDAYGAFRVFSSEKIDFTESDALFEQYYDQSDATATIAVMDTGIFAKSDYLQNHLTTKIDTTSDLNDTDYLDDITDFHGTKVAGNAAYGSNNIKLIDLRVQKGQVGTVDNSVNIASGIESAIEQGAIIVTSSVDIDWSKPAIQDVVDRNPEVLFITTGGNSNTELQTRSIDGTRGSKRTNALLVGGVTLDGGKHPSRGHGPAVDITVPSGSHDDTDRALTVTLPEAAAVIELIKNTRTFLEIQRGKLGEAESSLNKIEDKTSNKYKRIEKDVIFYERGIEKIKEQIEAWGIISASSLTTHSTESGVSFGLPVVANIAAKMKLINPNLTASQIREIMIGVAVSNSNETTRDLSESQGTLDPEKAYREAARLKQLIN